ncbi:MAG: alpha/beta hydrolase [Sphingomonadales bacterium]|nr:alpha/beta hydrolase [Sphingomonadales bacterium]
MADFVLIHGAWGGGWAYDRLAGELRDRGHRVLVAQLTGLGSRADEASPAITLSHHVTDVTQQVEAAGFTRFILAAHSWGGMVATGVSAKLGGRIDAICYIDAFLPGDGQSLWDITGQWEHDYYIAAQKDLPGLVLPFPASRGKPGYSRQPLLTLIEPVHFTGEEAKIPRRSYIYATGYQPTPFTRFRDTVAGDAGWDLHELDSTHDVMRDQPEALLAIMLGLAA